MAEELEKTCENCKYEYEDMEGTHCRHCIHNAEERFEPKEKETSETEIRNKAIDEFAEKIKFHLNGIRLNYDDAFGSIVAYMVIEDSKKMIDEIVEGMEGGGE